MNNTTSTFHSRRDNKYADLVAWCSAFGVLAVFIITGNAIAIAVLTRKRLLRRRTSYFLLSLTVADMLVGCVSVPMYIYQLSFALRGSYPVASTLYNIIRASDVFCSLASTFTLTIIALERVYAITFPLQHRVSTKRLYHVLVSSVWILAGVLSSFYFLFTYKILEHQVFFYFMMITFFLSLLIMLIAYITIWFMVRKALSFDANPQQASVLNSDSFAETKLTPERARKSLENGKKVARPRGGYRSVRKEGDINLGRTRPQSGREGSRAEHDRKLAVTLFIVTAVFVVTWLPFQIINLIIFFACKRFPCAAMPHLYTIYFCKLLNYSNSVINPVVYSLRLPEFQLALRKLVVKKCNLLF